MNNSTEAPTRLYYVDWLRVFAILGIFFFHNARFYDVFGDWHIKNTTTSVVASIPIAFMNEWLMPLFFLIAGASTYYALRSRRPAQYIKDRALRLLVPLIFGMVVVVAPQAYFEAVSHGAEFGGLNPFQVYRLFLQSLSSLPWYHLWFLAYLFVFSMVTIPILASRRERGTSVISRLAQLLEKPWMVLAFLVLSLAAVDVLLYPGGSWLSWGSRVQGNWSITAYLLFFISGYLIFANARVIETVKKFGWIVLGIGIVAMASLVIFFLDVLLDRAAYFGTSMYVASQIVQALNTWCWLLLILGLGSRFLNRNTRFLPYANEAVLPFYILHQTIIISIGFYVVQWEASIGLKYLTISITSLIAILLIYEFIVRRINVVRFLFGMRLRRRPRMALAIEGQT